MCTCSTGDVHMLNCRCTHAQLVYMLPVIVCMLHCMHAPTTGTIPGMFCHLAKLDTFLTHERPCQKVKIFTFQGVHMHNWKCAYAQLEVCTCSWQQEPFLEYSDIWQNVADNLIATYTSSFAIAWLSSLVEYKIAENIKKWKSFHILFFIVKR